MAKRKIGEVIDRYVQLRDAKEQLARKQKEEMAYYNEQLSTIEKWLHRELKEAGLTQQSSAQATAFIKSNDSCTVQDKSAFLEYVKANDKFELMDVRASKTVVREFMSNFGEIPPGIKFTQSETVNVRRK